MTSRWLLLPIFCLQGSSSLLAADSATRFDSYDAFYRSQSAKALPLSNISGRFEPQFVEAKPDKPVGFRWVNESSSQALDARWSETEGWRVAGRKLPIQTLNLPGKLAQRPGELDLETAGIYRWDNGQLCLEANLVGLGNTGKFQRLRSIVLFDRRAGRAWQYTGWFAACSAIRYEPDRAVLLTVSPGKQDDQFVASELVLRNGRGVTQPGGWQLQAISGDNPYVFSIQRLP
ncbi:hypothetical protein [Parachitinimonas caeni]|uniref:Uncharacterized protein n=1 Tax=Parachitinimonas caeni TaxID=3031301 RepID=A0ABT7E2K8_9NEIS|nr:hypothetical protein [Parachitinimonas caeni]MDK2126545.1 hypothetical protein [Parachitinimonas caeni]